MDLYPYPTTCGVWGASKAAEICLWLVKLSAWFELTPLPDDYWEFKVKRDVGEIMRRFIDTL